MFTTLFLLESHFHPSRAFYLESELKLYFESAALHNSKFALPLGVCFLPLCILIVQNMTALNILRLTRTQLKWNLRNEAKNNLADHYSTAQASVRV